VVFISTGEVIKGLPERVLSLKLSSQALQDATIHANYYDQQGHYNLISFATYVLR